MEDTGGKSGRRPGSHLQVEASGLGNAASVQQRLVGRFLRGTEAEGCVGGAEGRSKTLICLRGTWMEDAGGKSGRRPGRHLQVEASGPGNATSVQQRRGGLQAAKLLKVASAQDGPMSMLQAFYACRRALSWLYFRRGYSLAAFPPFGAARCAAQGRATTSWHLTPRRPRSNGRAKSLHSLSHGPGGPKPATIP